MHPEDPSRKKFKQGGFVECNYYKRMDGSHREKPTMNAGRLSFATCLKLALGHKRSPSVHKFMPWVEARGKTAFLHPDHPVRKIPKRQRRIFYLLGKFRSVGGRRCRV